MNEFRLRRGVYSEYFSSNDDAEEFIKFSSAIEITYVSCLGVEEMKWLIIYCKIMCMVIVEIKITLQTCEELIDA